MIGQLGLAIGSVIGGSVAPKFGIRKALIVFNLVSFLALGLKLFEVFWVIIIGRLVFGIATGI